MSLSYAPRPAPKTIRGWVELVLSWLLTSVLWGLMPLLVTLFFAIGIGLTPDLSNEFRVGGTVLALTLCGTQLIDDVPIPQQHLVIWKWLRNFSIILIAFGTIVAALNVVYRSGLDQMTVNLGLLNTSALTVFIGALVISLFAFLIRIIAANVSFEETVNQNTKDIIKEADNRNEVDGIKL